MHLNKVKIEFQQKIILINVEIVIREVIGFKAKLEKFKTVYILLIYYYYYYCFLLLLLSLLLLLLLLLN